MVWYNIYALKVLLLYRSLLHISTRRSAIQRDQLLVYVFFFSFDLGLVRTFPLSSFLK